MNDLIGWVTIVGLFSIPAILVFTYFYWSERRKKERKLEERIRELEKRAAEKEKQN